MDHPIKVLIVEDDPANLALLEYLAKTFSLGTLTATNVASARKILADRTPEIVILDVGLGDGEVAALLDEIRGSEHATAVALLTETPDKLQRHGYGAWYPDAVFSKSLDVRLIGGWLKEQMLRFKATEYEYAFAA